MVLLVVPPVCPESTPAYGPHLLQAILRNAGLPTSVAYANGSFADAVGRDTFRRLSEVKQSLLIGERLFCRSAFGVAPLGSRVDPTWNTFLVSGEFSYEALEAVEAVAHSWVLRVGRSIAEHPAPIIGFTCSFQQIAASIAIAGVVRKHSPQKRILVGGANCEGSMAAALAELAGDVFDVAVSGKCEASIVQTIQDLLSGKRVAKVVAGDEALDLNSLPDVGYDDYFKLVLSFPKEPNLALTAIPSLADTWVPYESSRGCWWGAKHHCTFCGIPDARMQYREKRPERVLEELKTLTANGRYPRVRFVDDIVPPDAHKSVFPAIAASQLDLELFVEVKANLTYWHTKAMREAGVVVFQPGIESLSSPILKRMAKGVSARQNIALLRFARSLGMYPYWNFLYGFPGDLMGDYLNCAELIDLIPHLTPPQYFGPINVLRFSPYFEQAGKFGISELRPVPSYYDVFGNNPFVTHFAYFFDATFQSESLEKKEFVQSLRAVVEPWQRLWNSQSMPPSLHVSRLTQERYFVLDTRNNSSRRGTIVSREEALFLVCGQGQPSDDFLATAISNRMIASIDGSLTPLASAEVDVLDEFLGRSPPSSEVGTTWNEVVRISRTKK